MRYRFACDCHNHSSCSPDGNDTVLEMRRRAQELGLWAHTLTDHCECQKFPERYRPRVERAWEEMALEIPQGGSTGFTGASSWAQPNQDLEAAEQALPAGTTTSSSALSTTSVGMRISFSWTTRK